MSFVPTMRLDYSNAVESQVVNSKRTVSQWLESYIKMTVTHLHGGPIWEGGVVFIEDGDTGRYMGRVGSYFFKGGKTHIKFPSGEILVLEFASYVQ